MAQVLEFKLPDLGEGLTEATIVSWLVQVGDVVAVDQPVVEVETAKAMVEVPCPYGGVVTARFGDEGTELPVGAALLTVAVGASDGAPVRTGAAGAGAGAGAESGSAAAGDVVAAKGGKAEGSGNVLVGYGTSAAPARRRRVRPTVSNGVPERREPPRVVPAPGPIPVISPLVRRLARENGLDLRAVKGSGPEGLILRSDVERAVADRPATAATASSTVVDVMPSASADAMPMPSEEPTPTAAASAPASAPAAPQGHRTPLRGIRGAIADKLSRSRTEIPDATCWVDADATELLRARAVMNAATGPSAGPKISVLALLARICTAALARFPELNATVDMERREIVRLDAVHLGFAAQTERGLVVPVVRDAHARGAESLSAEFARLTDKARAGTLTPGELTGGTFTLNNYGVFGVDGSTPIINHPEAAMLGVGRIAPKPWVHEGELAVRQVVQLSLTFDHRVCDGGTAGGFLRYVADCVEQPAVLLRTL
ncbi:dihydrolipoamide acetyltransferase family protein [Streptomyces sp. VRA16 Mangrove soil]|uniref:dihydrolipoamide acetyltransferase family protein n=1 Tax=Streptomyces sp. VRA16 Mangrove soil TaxID=2817434 RepID=UPI001A9F94A0|nr:dihydrolipoamide acetyltransferase family protein [Streptomyces sp. VRA16 Mangrove soil]MBO1333526.1 2-oxo acid dehydrogenase subunit E2 [Streptomyces sp. VRA16 Mangrove soil]